MRKYFRGLRAKCTGPATRRTALGELAPTPAIDIRGPSRQGAARAPLPKVRATDAGSDLERGPRRSGPTFSDAAALRALGAAGGDLPDPSHQAQPRVRLLQIVFGLAHGHRSRPHLLCRRQHTVRRGGDTRCAPDGALFTIDLHGVLPCHKTLRRRSLLLRQFPLRESFCTPGFSVKVELDHGSG
ncbi:uncharacterized protein LOC112879493 isoform X2 [Panicum hallii]|uniref:uncharacterized protein LOC112879493 isoform X2 n=1 Tax=Panicum hallii TaxID=206008 RepID=UPI000DF4CC9B|nr:uncharacterized protein LOC112879493 isoform X2 [Panicum hallii]